MYKESFDVSKRITYLRTQKNYSVNKLANAAGISQSFLRDVELGNKNITVEYLSYIWKDVQWFRYIQNIPPDGKTARRPAGFPRCYGWINIISRKEGNWLCFCWNLKRDSIKINSSNPSAFIVKFDYIYPIFIFLMTISSWILNISMRLSCISLYAGIPLFFRRLPS